MHAQFDYYIIFTGTRFGNLNYCTDQLFILNNDKPDVSYFTVQRPLLPTLAHAVRMRLHVQRMHVLSQHTVQTYRR